MQVTRPQTNRRETFFKIHRTKTVTLNLNSNVVIGSTTNFKVALLLAIKNSVFRKITPKIDCQKFRFFPLDGTRHRRMTMSKKNELSDHMRFELKFVKRNLLLLTKVLSKNLSGINSSRFCRQIEFAVHLWAIFVCLSVLTHTHWKKTAKIKVLNSNISSNKMPSSFHWVVKTEK